jgi:hypothetical protein
MSGKILFSGSCLIALALIALQPTNAFARGGGGGGGGGGGHASFSGGSSGGSGMHFSSGGSVGRAPSAGNMSVSRAPSISSASPAVRTISPGSMHVSSPSSVHVSSGNSVGRSIAVSHVPPSGSHSGGASSSVSHGQTIKVQPPVNAAPRSDKNISSTPKITTNPYVARSDGHTEHGKETAEHAGKSFDWDHYGDHFRHGFREHGIDWDDLIGYPFLFGLGYYPFYNAYPYYYGSYDPYGYEYPYYDYYGSYAPAANEYAYADSTIVPSAATAPETEIVPTTEDSSLGDQFLSQALDAFKKQDYGNALRLATHAAVEEPGNAKVHELMSLAMFALGDYRNAAIQSHIVATAGKVADWPTLYSYYGNVDTYTTQLRALEKYVNDNPTSAEGHFLLGYHDLMMGKKDAAKDQLAKAIKETPKDEVAQALVDKNLK